MSCSQILRIGVGVAVSAAALAAPSHAQQPQQPQPVVLKQIKGDIYWATGGAGSNSGIIVGKTGVILVDAKTSPDSEKQVVAEIAKITPKPVTTVILTHSDGDHVNGLAGLPAGLTIIAHVNNKKELDEALAAGGRGAPPPDRLPTRVVTQNRETLTIDGVKLELLHWVPAHTSGDLVVFLPDERIAFTGDITATNRPDPIIHLEKNGSSEGWLTATKAIAALAADQFVPGHGDLQTKADLQARTKMVEAKRNTIAAMIKQGKSLDEIKAAVGDTPPAPPAGAPAGGRQGGPAFGSLSDIVYQELAKK